MNLNQQEENANRQPLAGQGVREQQSSTYSGVVLLGWMQREKAIRFLLEDCVFDPPLNAGEAEKLWRSRRDCVAASPRITSISVERYSLSEAQQEHADRFLCSLAAAGTCNTEVVKIDPMGLKVAQFAITVDVAADYAERCQSETDWLSQNLPLSAEPPDLRMRFTQRSMDSDIDIELPHAEFIFGMNRLGGFGPKEVLGHVAALQTGDGLLLAKGYHRLYGRMVSSEGRVPERLTVVALDSGSEAQPPATDGLRSAIFADFFNEELAMPVSLKRKRYELQVRARWVALDYP